MEKVNVHTTPEGIFLTRTGTQGEVYAFHVGADGRLKFGQKAALPPRPAITQTFTADAVYGAFSLLKGYYVAFITSSAKVGTAPNGSPIYQVLDMDWYLVGNGYATSVKDIEKGGAGGPVLSAAQQVEEDTHLSLLKRVSETRSFYYSPGYDLTNSLQRNDTAASGGMYPDAGGAGSPLSPQPGWVHSDERFFWNRAALREVLAAGAGEPASSSPSSSGGTHPFVVPVINGFVGAKHVAEFGAELLLISRRACGRQGTRFNMRGADLEGNVANYAETEQMLMFGSGDVASYVQVRGSIPLLWEQPVSLKYTPKCTLHPNTSASQAVFNRHAAALLDRYARVTAVNLIDKKGDQKTLGEAYSAAAAHFAAAGSGHGAATVATGGKAGGTTNPIYAGAGAANGKPGSSSSSPFRFVWFDFHGETKSSKGGWKNLSKLLEEVRGELEADGVYKRDKDGRVVAVQKGTVRTNCMDNLDRTNVVQSLFARQAALTAVPGALDRTRASGMSVLTSPYPEFERAFNHLWADNADAMSMLYSGTGALKTDFTRTGKRTMAGAIQDGINSCQRYILNNMDDGRMQDAWDLFLGRYVPTPAHQHQAAGKGGKGVHYSAPMAKHLAGPSPTGVLVRVVVVFAGLTVAIAYGLTSPKYSQVYRLSIGAGGAGVALAALAFAVVAKGWLRGIAGPLISRPSFIPHIPVHHHEVEAVVAGSPSGTASFAHSGRDRDGVVGGAHAREHGTLVPGINVSHAAAEEGQAQPGSGRVKMA